MLLVFGIPPCSHEDAGKTRPWKAALSQNAYNHHSVTNEILLSLGERQISGRSVETEVKGSGSPPGVVEGAPHTPNVLPTGVTCSADAQHSPQVTM